jgi:hypothetical protein
MFKTTLDGEPIIIEYNKQMNKYVVYYDDEIRIMDERPTTDQDLEDQLIRLRMEIYDVRIKLLSNCLIKLLEPLLEN